MSWNYRAVKLATGDDTYFGVCEAFYHEDGSLKGVTDPVTFGGETIEEAIRALRLAIDSLEKYGELVLKPKA